jgi:hypothetical protein
MVELDAAVTDGARSHRLKDRCRCIRTGVERQIQACKTLFDDFFDRPIKNGRARFGAAANPQANSVEFR